MRLRRKALKEIMQQQGITEAMLRARTGMERFAVAYILRDGFCSAEAAELIAEALGVKIQDISDIETPRKSSVGFTENVIEFTKDADTASVSLSQGRYKSRIRELVEKYPDKCRIIAENADGSLYARIPVSWVKISPTKILNHNQVEAARRNILKAQSSRHESPYISI